MKRRRPGVHFDTGPEKPRVHSPYGGIPLRDHPLFHPAAEANPVDQQYIDPAIEAYCRDRNRRAELGALVSTTVKSVIDKSGFVLTNYRQLAEKDSLESNQNINPAVQKTATTIL